MNPAHRPQHLADPSKGQKKLCFAEIDWFFLIKDGNVEALKVVGARCPFPDPFVDEQGNSPLHIASIIGNILMFEYLNQTIKQNGITTPARNSEEKTCFLLAAEHGHLPLLTYFLTRFVKYPMFYTDNQTLRNLLAHSAAGNTSLILASRSGHIHIVKYLIDKGASINATNNNGSRSLLLASQNGHTEIAKYLIDKGASIGATITNRYTSLMVASCHGHLDIVEYLIDKGASIDAIFDDGKTSLLLASENGHILIVQYLIDKGASVHTATDRGDTSLILASENGHIEIVKYLVDKGASIHARTVAGETSLILSSQYGHIDIVKYLIDKGASIDDIAINGTYTSIVCATITGKIAVAEYLIEVANRTWKQERIIAEGKLILLKITESQNVQRKYPVGENQFKILEMLINDGWIEIENMKDSPYHTKLIAMMKAKKVIKRAQ